MDNQIQCKHCTRSFKSPMSLRSHMKVHKQKQPHHQPSGVTYSASSSNPKNDQAEVPMTTTTMAMVVLVEQPFTYLQMIVPSLYNNHVADNHQVSRQRRQYVCVDCDMSFNSHYALGGHRSSKHSRKRSLLSLPAPNEGLRRSQRLRLFGFNLDVPASSS